MEDKTIGSSLVVLHFTNDKVPAFVEPKPTAKNKWVKYGETNNYPQFLLTLFNRSAKHNAICTSKQSYIKGQGFTFDQAEMLPDDIAKLKAFVDSPNPYETLTDLMNKTALDNELFGGFYLRVTGSKGGGVAVISHQDYSTVRSTEDNKAFFISDYWIDESGNEKLNLKPDEFTSLPAYEEGKKQKESIFYYKSYRPGLKTYTLPEYIGAVPAIITDAEIANYHRAEIQNSFKGSKMIVFKNGVPTDEEMKATERKLKAKFTPTDQAGTFVIDFVDDPNRTPEILDLSGGDFADKYDALNNTIQQEIFVGHKITSPMLFGVRVEGQLGGRSEMIDAYNIFQNTYVAPKQEIQRIVYDHFAPVNGKIKITPAEPIMPSFSEATLSQILTKDEMREIIGRKPLDVKPVSVVNDLNALSPLVANKVLSQLTSNEVRAIVSKPALPGGDIIPSAVPADTSKFDKTDNDDEIDFTVFQKYGEPIENFTLVKQKNFITSMQEFGLTKIEEGVFDLIKKTVDISIESLIKNLKVGKTVIQDALETLAAEGLIDITKTGIKTTPKGDEKSVPSFADLFIRYRYVERYDAPALIPGGESRSFCKAMIDNPRYFSKQDIEMISVELGQIYGIAGYDAFRRRGGWLHDVRTDTNLPFCRHSWEATLVKKIR